ncbi:MAG: FAD-binding domain-containing protein [Verrucomicrobiota bacterium]
MDSGVNFSFPATRKGALKRLHGFLTDPRSKALRYASRRNFVYPGDPTVSRLSPAFRTGLVTSLEACKLAEEHHDPEKIEKFEQEIFWRLYWKGWLEKRPSIWRQYQQELLETQSYASARAQDVMNGESGVAIMDHFAQELVRTGYLHNHARMWWAAFWVHVEKLPWQLGADFFLRHLLDGDPASNTLSWRWVAGLHTRGKSYLVRRSNLEKYVDAHRIEHFAAGLERLDPPQQVNLPFVEPPPPKPLVDTDSLPEQGRCGIWLHDEALALENSPLSECTPHAVAATADTCSWDESGFSKQKQNYFKDALHDGLSRAQRQFDAPSSFLEGNPLPEALASWARSVSLDHMIAIRPAVGPLLDQISLIRSGLRKDGISLILVRDSAELSILDKANAGFFGFWKKAQKIWEKGRNLDRV